MLRIEKDRQRGEGGWVFIIANSTFLSLIRRRGQAGGKGPLDFEI